MRFIFMEPRGSYWSIRRQTRNLVTAKNKFRGFLYSKEIYEVAAQQSIVIYSKFVNFTSVDKTQSPDVVNCGYMFHCHRSAHPTDR